MILNRTNQQANVQPPLENRNVPERESIFAIPIAVILAVSTLGMLSYQIWQGSVQSEAQKAAIEIENKKPLFFTAIENLMKVPYLAQRASEKLGTPPNYTDTLYLESLSDFSDIVTPKTRLTYRTEPIGTTTATDTRNLIVIGSDLYAMVPAGVDIGNETYTNDQWYHILGGNEAAKQTLDVLNVGEGANSQLGQIFVGQFTDDQRQTFMKFINENNVYTVKQATSEKLNDKNTMHYVVEINVAKLKELNKVAAARLSVKDTLGSAPEDAPIIEKFDAWVDKNDKRIKKIIFENKYPKTGIKSDSTFEYDYPSKSPNVVPPEGSVDAP